MKDGPSFMNQTNPRARLCYQFAAVGGALICNQRKARARKKKTAPTPSHPGPCDSVLKANTESLREWRLAGVLGGAQRWLR